MRIKKAFYFSATLMFILFSFSQCQTKSAQEVSTPEKVIVQAAEDAMGGRVAYDQIKYLTWNFFGSRMWWWNKGTGDVRCENLRDSSVFLMNIHTMEGKYRLKHVEITKPDTLKKYLQKGKNAWINDSYWLVMPFKLEDPGTHLKHLGPDTTLDGRSAELMELTFDNVGVTPDNKYVIYFDQESKLVTQWDYYRTSDAKEPRFQGPWQEYEEHGGVLFSRDRGRRQITGIGAPDSLPKEIFEDITTPASEILSKAES